MADLGDAVERWTQVPADVGLRFDERRGIAECDVPHPEEPGWRVWGRFVLSDHRLVLVEVRVFPAVEGYPRQVPELTGAWAGGVTMRMLRDVRLGDLFEPVQSWAALKSVGRSPSDVFSEMASAPNPGRQGRGDRYYAEWARRLHEATQSASRSPIQDVANAAGIRRDQLRDLATEARRRGLYAPRGRGRGGGYLTDLGRQVLEQETEER